MFACASQVIVAVVPLRATCNPVGCSHDGPIAVIVSVSFQVLLPSAIATFIVATWPSGTFSATVKLNVVLAVALRAIAPIVCSAVLSVMYSSVVERVAVVLALVDTPPLFTNVTERSLVVP